MNEAQLALQELGAKFSMPQIHSFLGHTVSVRTLYRWMRGHTSPQREADKLAILKLKATVIGG